mgnify:CR=1 FL=1
MFQDLTKRIPALEEMDKEDIAPEALEGALASLMRINVIGNGAGIFWPEIRALLEARVPSKGPMRVLDIGCGAGDLAQKLETRARKRGYDLAVDGCDFSPVAVAMAQRLYGTTERPNRFFVLDAITDPIPDDYDIIMNSLFFHHLDNEAGKLVLEKMAESTREAVLMSDLIRSRFGLGLVYLATRTLSRSPIVHADGVTSLLAAYSMEEVSDLTKSLDLTGATVTRRWPERFLLRWRKQGPTIDV